MKLGTGYTGFSNIKSNLKLLKQNSISKSRKNDSNNQQSKKETDD
jgi:hypothetical protein